MNFRQFFTLLASACVTVCFIVQVNSFPSNGELTNVVQVTSNGAADSSENEDLERVSAEDVKGPTVQETGFNTQIRPSSDIDATESSGFNSTETTEISTVTMDEVATESAIVVDNSDAIGELTTTVNPAPVEPNLSKSGGNVSGGWSKHKPMNASSFRVWNSPVLECPSGQAKDPNGNCRPRFNMGRE